MLRQIEQQRPATPPPKPPPRPAPPPMQHPGQAVLTVHSFQFSGNSLLKEEQLASAVAAFLNRPLSFEELQEAAVAVATAYRGAGWVVRAYLPQQEIADGKVTIQIVEARFGGVRAEGESTRVPFDRIRSRVESAQTPGQALNANALDRALLLIDDLPGVVATGRLEEGQQQAETDLVLTLGDGPLISGSVTVDNTGARSTGPVRATLDLGFNSPLRLGDRVGGTLLHTRGSDFGRVDYSLPLGADGWRIGANLSHLSYWLVSPEFQSLNARGTSTTGGFDLSYPLLRSRAGNLTVALAVDGKRFDNQSSGVTTTRYKTGTAGLSLTGNAFDDWLAGGANSGSLALVQGRVDLAGSPNEEADGDSVRTAGAFRKLRYAFSRQQALTDWLSLTASITGQLASKNLDSSEKFYLGGSTGVRAYPANEAGGSEGHVLSLEARVRLPADLNLSGFFDSGAIRVNRKNDIAGAAILNSYSLRGIGISVSWTASFGLGLKATWARRVGDNPNPTSSGLDQDGSLQRNRLWLQASQPF